MADSESMQGMEEALKAVAIEEAEAVATKAQRRKDAATWLAGEKEKVRFYWGRNTGASRDYYAPVSSRLFEWKSLLKFTAGNCVSSLHSRLLTNIFALPYILHFLPYKIPIQTPQQHERDIQILIRINRKITAKLFAQSTWLCRGYFQSYGYISVLLESCFIWSGAFVFFYYDLWEQYHTRALSLCAIVVMFHYFWCIRKP